MTLNEIIDFLENQNLNVLEAMKQNNLVLVNVTDKELTPKLLKIHMVLAQMEHLNNSLIKEITKRYYK